jgi:hypothetical protein
MSKLEVFNDIFSAFLPCPTTWKESELLILKNIKEYDR